MPKAGGSHGRQACFAPRAAAPPRAVVNHRMAWLCMCPALQPCLLPPSSQARPPQGCLRRLPALSADWMVFLSSSFSRRSTSSGWDSPSARTASGPREAGLRAPAGRGVGRGR